MKNSMRAMAATAGLALMLGACSAAPEAEKTATAEGTAAPVASAKDFKACMVSDEGGFDDKSFNQSGFEGLQRAQKELGIQIASTESNSDADFEPNLNKLIGEKCNLIFAVGFKLASATYNAAKAHPDVDFALIDSAEPFDEKAGKPLDKLPNFKPLVFNTAEAAFLAGYAAAGMTQTGKVGTYLGMKLPTTAIFADGFADGIKRYNADHGTDVKLLGWDKDKQDGQATGDFSDVNKGKATTTNLINQGADIIMPVAGPVGAGTLAAAKEANDGGKNISVVWVDSDGVLTNPNDSKLILTSVMKLIGEAVFDTTKDLVDGKPFSSDPYVGNVANKGVDIAPFHDFDSKVSDDLRAKLDELRKQIADGSLKVESPNSPK
ncbi:BMP family ABC transporter substrate-binding protein [Boudabousia tangfeifanii]|uniref:BMP family ABC transporter substrate-binding protein n=1 Tax=Boudabousia tangfeifanii TaxID=1912795 RepID=A0A1D9ML32_9ACTO|nr:BMP family ABC transporter substrate-binding protein [Boudabousia tangfeifanii]AOZ72996.1 BMP family ABC transporter substrate-binding protein [Boudabousia tangfeifanii]